MVATSKKIGSNEIFNLELSFIEMHILIQAMSEYGMHGYNKSLTKAEDFNYAHASAAEHLHDELSDIYCK